MACVFARQAHSDAEAAELDLVVDPLHFIDIQPVLKLTQLVWAVCGGWCSGVWAVLLTSCCLPNAHLQSQHILVFVLVLSWCVASTIVHCGSKVLSHQFAGASVQFQGVAVPVPCSIFHRVAGKCCRWLVVVISWS